MTYFPHLSGKRVLLVSHVLSQSGAPLLLVETASALAKSGARVALTNLGLKERVFCIPTVEGLRVVPASESFTEAYKADLIIANTAATKEWVNDLLTLAVAGIPNPVCRQSRCEAWESRMTAPARDKLFIPLP